MEYKTIKISTKEAWITLNSRELYSAFKHVIHDLHSTRLKSDIDDALFYFFIRDLGEEPVSGEMVPDFLPVDIAQLSQLSQMLSHNKDIRGNKLFDELTVADNLTKVWSDKYGEHVEQVSEKLIRAIYHMPRKILHEGGFSKLVRVMIGVLLHKAYILHKQSITPEMFNDEKIKNQLTEAMFLGYYYGISYMLDDILDNKITNEKLRNTIQKIIDDALEKGSIDTNNMPESNTMKLAIEAFNFFENTFPRDKYPQLWEIFKLFNKYQREDGKLKFGAEYNNDYFYNLLRGKSAYSRIIAFMLANNGKLDLSTEHNMFQIALFNQLIDDLRDFYVDRRQANVTPFTYYEHAKLHNNKKIIESFANPLLMLFNELSILLDKYKNNARARRLLITRVIQAFKHIKISQGKHGLLYFADVFKSGIPDIDWTVMNIIQNTKYVRDFEGSFLNKVSEVSLKLRGKTDDALDLINDTQELLDAHLYLPEDKLINKAINHALEGGKRIRPALARMASHLFGIDDKNILPLMLALEYVHTASLIMDDLPAQDNATKRRGKLSVHIKFGEDVAQLAATDLIFKGTNHILLLNQSFEHGVVNKICQYFMEVGSIITEGQLNDLQKNAKTLKELEMVAKKKTGIAIESAILPIAWLSKVDEQEVIFSKRYAELLGLMYQAKDDLLDKESSSKIGKDSKLDEKNGAITFVTLLGVDGTMKYIDDKLTKINELLNEWTNAYGRDTTTLQNLANFVAKRKK